jgi:hypothetical protein
MANDNQPPKERGVAGVETEPSPQFFRHSTGGSLSLDPSHPKRYC